MLRNLSVIALVLFAATACSDIEEPTELEPSVKTSAITVSGPYAGLSDGQVGESIMQMLNQMVAVSGTRAVDDCERQGAALKAVVDDHRDLIAEAHARLDDTTVEGWFNTEYESKAKDVVARLVPVVKACGRDPQVVAVIEALER